MTGFLLPDDRPEPIRSLLVGVSVAQPRTKIVLGHAEEARAYFSVGGEPDAIAVAAEGLADGSDQAELAAAIGKDPAFRRGGRVVGRRRAQIEAGLQAGEDFPAGHDHFLEPGAGGI